MFHHTAWNNEDISFDKVIFGLSKVCRELGTPSNTDGTNNISSREASYLAAGFQALSSEDDDPQNIEYSAKDAKGEGRARPHPGGPEQQDSVLSWPAYL